MSEKLAASVRLVTLRCEALERLGRVVIELQQIADALTAETRMAAARIEAGDLVIYADDGVAPVGLGDGEVAGIALHGASPGQMLMYTKTGTWPYVHPEIRP